MNASIPIVPSMQFHQDCKLVLRRDEREATTGMRKDTVRESIQKATRATIRKG
jgi:hypothetical protein